MSEGNPENYKGMYGSLKFPAFKMQEYPKLIYNEDRSKVIGTAANAMEEKEIYASIGVDKADIDPVGAMQDELVTLKARLAQYEGADPANQISAAKVSNVKTNTVEMLGADTTPKADVPKGNPLLKTVGEPGKVGTAPSIQKQIDPGV